jgi:Mn2+/Fe2+ NRAMP family transporter
VYELLHTPDRHSSSQQKPYPPQLNTTTMALRTLALIAFALIAFAGIALAAPQVSHHPAPAHHPVPQPIQLVKLE